MGLKGRKNVRKVEGLKKQTETLDFKKLKQIRKNQKTRKKRTKKEKKRTKKKKREKTTKNRLAYFITGVLIIFPGLATLYHRGYTDCM